MCTLAKIIVTSKQKRILWIEPGKLIDFDNRAVITTMLLGNLAVIRHQIPVRFVVRGQRRVSIECFLTDLAFEGSFVGVDNLVTT